MSFNLELFRLLIIVGAVDRANGEDDIEVWWVFGVVNLGADTKIFCVWGVLLQCIVAGVVVLILVLLRIWWLFTGFVSNIKILPLVGNAFTEPVRINFSVVDGPNVVSILLPPVLDDGFCDVVADANVCEHLVIGVVVGRLICFEPPPLLIIW